MIKTATVYKLQASEAYSKIRL